MIRNNVKSLLIIPIFIFILISKLNGTTITADNPNFQFNGRINFAVPDKPVIYWPGTYIKANFEGTSIAVLLNDSTGQSFYNVFIDEDYEHPYLIDCKAGINSYAISTTLTDTVHSLLIFRRTEASTGSTKFLGIEIGDGKTLHEPPARHERKILFYGDSITCGMGNEAPDSYADDNLKYENNFLAYGAVASRLLNAEYMCIAKSGIGIMISWFNMVMSQYYYRLDPEKPDSNWDFSQFIPDVVVINLFQNDSWLTYKLNPVPDSTQITKAYADFVREIRNHHPNAFIVCTLGSMDATKTGSRWPGYIKNAVENLRVEDNDSNIGTYFFPFSSTWTKHPRIRHHKEMGQNLAAYITEKTGWLSDVENSYVAQAPTNFQLIQNYPNPFNPSTTIEYLIAKPGKVKIVIYNALGSEIQTIVNEYKSAGSYKEVFNAKNLSSGIYYYQLICENNIQTKPMVLLK
ncbi:MAG: T9SS type A sorting domain-containing protein [Ignavibacteriales bacterium]|nr:T9SS type A sorting domain-containing protein [Ignavibacteriales bacterium]